MTTQESYNYGELTSAEARSAYFGRILDQDVVAETEDSLREVLSYIDYLKQGLESCGLEREEAIRSAADTVFKGLSACIKDGRSSKVLGRLDDLDSLIRRAHDIDPRNFPDRHEDPYVAAFYTSLGNHLLKRMPGDRVDAYGGYSSD